MVGATIKYQILNLSRLKVGDLDLSAQEPDDADLSPEDEAELAQLAFPVTA